MKTQSFSISELHTLNQNNIWSDQFKNNGCRLPLIISLTTAVSFKISLLQQQFSCAFAEIILRNKASFQVRPTFKMMFIRQMQLICNEKLKELELQNQYFEKTSYNQNSYSEKSASRNNFLFQINIVLQNNLPKIHFNQSQQSRGNIYIQNVYLLKNFINFLQLLEQPLNVLLAKMGTLKPSFSDRLSNNLKISKQKKVLKKIFRQKNKSEEECEEISMENQDNSNNVGVFQKVEVLKQLPIDEHQFSFKRGGYFNIEKKKFIIKNQNQNQQQACVKYMAEKSLSKRKRPNTIFNYQGKAQRELNFLQQFHKLSRLQLEQFAQYYVLIFPMKMYSTPDDFSMLDEDQIKSKDSLSTIESNEQLHRNGLTSNIYMEYYPQNLEEYLNRKEGDLDIFEKIFLLKQIFESVILVHKVGIVHRDIKPANFMIEMTQDGRPRTKLIDFGESVSVSAEFNEKQVLGFTAKYAPIECAFSCKEGFNSKQIDLWSVGVVVYQITTGKFPVNHTKCFKNDIKNGWPTDLNFFSKQHLKGRWQLPQNMLVVLATSLMKVKPDQRLNLKLGLKILDKIQKLAKQLSEQTLNHLL